MGKRLIIMRHGQTDWNVENRFQGHTDIPLNAIGRAQVARAASILGTQDIDHIISSDLQRAFDTAAAVAAVKKLKVIPDPQLRETHCGSWEGRTGPDIEASDGENLARWFDGDDIPAGGDGERRSEVVKRMMSALDTGLRNCATGQTLLVVTHGGAARGVIGALLGLAISDWVAIGGLANASWSIVEERNSRWRLIEHNSGVLPEPILGQESSQ
ncbi:MAG: histidine phosphatase family protein [Actinomycetota bacterium]